MIDLGPEFHSRRALKQAEQRAIDERLAHEDHRRALESDPIHQASLAAELEEHRRITDGFDGLTKEEQVDVLAGVPLSVGERAKLAFGRLGMGLALGATAGWVIGTAYALRHGKPPMRVGMSGALSMGVLGGQFVGLRDLLPIGLERAYWKLLATEQERRAGIPLSEVLDLPGVDLPAFVQDMTERDRAVVRSAAAGAGAGFMTVYMQASELMRASQVKSRHPWSAGVRGAAFWGLAFGCGHYALAALDDWRRRRIVDRRLREMYSAEQYDEIRRLMGSGGEDVVDNVGEDVMGVAKVPHSAIATPMKQSPFAATNTTNDTPSTLSQHVAAGLQATDTQTEMASDTTTPSDIPARDTVVPNTIRDILDRPLATLRTVGWAQKAIALLPMVHEQKEYERRAYQESKIRLLETELQEMAKSERRRKRRIAKLEKELSERVSDVGVEV